MDEVVCIDGAYTDFPHNECYSTDGTLELVKKNATKVITAGVPWASQIVKRNAYLHLSKDFKGYLFIIDADEVLQGKFPKKMTALEYVIPVISKTYTINQIRLIKNREGLQYKDKHSFLYCKGDLINDPLTNTKAPTLEGITIQHNFHLRTSERLHIDGEYMRKRNEADQPVSKQEDSKGLVTMIFSGKYYNGTDGNRDISILAGQSIEVSPEKAQQLLSDFPKDWRKL